VGALHRQADREKSLDDVVVQIPGDPVPVGEHFQFAARRLILRPVQRQRGLVGERGHDLKFVLVEAR
jgi:hypothetical protein